MKTPPRPASTSQLGITEHWNAIDDLRTRIIRIEVGIGVLAALGIGGMAFSTLTAPDVVVESKKAEERLRSLSDSVNRQLESRRANALADISRMYVVSPVGWQNSGIRVDSGQTVELHAYGRVTVAYGELIDRDSKRRQIERRRIQANADVDDFSESELDSLTPRYDWVGPDGYPGRYRSQTKRRREATLPLPDVPIGSLVGAISEDGGSPEKPNGQPFFVGSRTPTFTARHSGVFWFGVNDVGRYPDKPPDYAKIYYRDNAGFFVVYVSVR